MLDIILIATVIIGWAIAMIWAYWNNADSVDPVAPESFAKDEIRWAGDVYGYKDEMEDNEE